MGDGQEQLVRRAVAGDEQALSELLNHHAPPLAWQPRVHDAHLSKVDLGAYEYGTFGDLDGDCDAGSADLAQLLGSSGTACE